MTDLTATLTQISDDDAMFEAAFAASEARNPFHDHVFDAGCFVNKDGVKVVVFHLDSATLPDDVQATMVVVTLPSAAMLLLNDDASYLEFCKA